MVDPVSVPRFGSRLRHWVLVAGLSVLWLVDLAAAVPGGFVPPASGAASAVLVFAPTRLPLAWRAGVAAAGSWTVTAILAPSHWGVLGTWGLLETGVLLWLLMRTVREVKPPQLAAGLGAGLAFVVITMPVRISLSEDLISFSFILTFLVAAVVGLGSYLRALDSRRLRMVEAVRNQERLDLARDLHDFVAHHVTGIVVQAQAARTIGALSPDQVGPILDSIEKAGMETLASMRRLVQVLRQEGTARARPAEGFAELARLITAFSAGGPPAALRVSDEARAALLAPEVATSVHRVVQEALTNVRRHAPGSPAVAVLITAGGGLLEVAVRNEPPPGTNGRSTPPGGTGGFGLVGLRERVEAVGGRLRAAPLPGGGWEVAAQFPVLSMTGSRA